MLDLFAVRDQHGLLAQCDVVREKLQNFLSVIKTEPIDKHEDKDECSESDGEGEDESSVGMVRQTMTVVEEETATLRAEVSNNQLSLY